MQKILIYQDHGADPFCVNSLLASLQQVHVEPFYSIEIVNRLYFQSKFWQKNVAALIFPGGRDIPYHAALKGAANASIRNFVLDGGAYFGICAGSYYGSAQIEFEKGGPLEVLAERELQFFPGIARGPAYGKGKFCYHNDSGGQIASLTHSASFIPQKMSAAYFNGGCTFVDAESHDNVTVIGRYSDINGCPPAIIDCRIGEGKAILCGVHPEYSAYFPLIKAKFSDSHFTALKEIEQSRRQLFSQLLKQLGLKLH